jgi:FkbM family methyltransferase
VRQFLNTLLQIAHSDSVGTLPGLWRHLHWHLRRALRLFPCVLPLAASRLYVDQPSGVGALVNAMGEYDYNNMRLLRLVLGRGESTFVDVGANIGSYTLIAAELPNVRVVSIEPHPATFALLAQNVHLNGRSNVKCLNLALSAWDAETHFTDEAESSLNRIVSGENEEGGRLRVPCRRLDGLCRDLNFTPEFIKIDVEGQECAVLDGFGNHKSSAKIIFIEGGENPDVQRWMEAAGYSGPWFSHFNRRILSGERQKRPEDPVYVRRDFLPELKRMNFEVPAGHNAAAPAPAGSCATRPFPGRTVFLTNFIAPYVLPVLQQLKARVKSLRVFVCTPMEPDRTWQAAWGDLDVTVQRTITLVHREVYKQGFARTSFRHFPFDSLPLLYRHRPDAIVSVQLGLRTMQAAAYRLANSACRLIILADLSEHTEKEIGCLRTIARRALLAVADAVLVNGASGKRYVRRLGVPLGRIVEAPYTTDMTPFEAVSLAREPRVARRLVYAGQLIESKGLKLLTQALLQWSAEHSSQVCEVWFIGAGPFEKQLGRFSLPRNLIVKLMGNVSQDELARYYADAGIFVLPTLLDTWAVVVNEALAAGLPVMGSVYSQAVEELVRNGVNGWRFHPDDPGEFQCVLTQTLSTPLTTLEEMRKAARRSVRHLTPEYAAGRFLEAMRVAERKNTRAGSALQVQSCEQRP